MRLFNAGTVLQRYQQLVQSGALRTDAAQARVAARLSALCDELSIYKGKVEDHNKAVAHHEVTRTYYHSGLERACACTSSSSPGTCHPQYRAPPN